MNTNNVMVNRSIRFLFNLCCTKQRIHRDDFSVGCTCKLNWELHWHTLSMRNMWSSDTFDLKTTCWQRRNTHTRKHHGSHSQVEHVVVHTQAVRQDRGGGQWPLPSFQWCRWLLLEGGKEGYMAQLHHTQPTRRQRDKAQGCLGTVSHGWYDALGIGKSVILTVCHCIRLFSSI